MAKAKKRYIASNSPSEKRFIPVPEEFTDLAGRPWTFTFPGEKTEILSFLEVLLYTARFCRRRDENPPPGDTDRLLGFCEDFLAANTAGSDIIEMSRNDFEWMVTQFRDHGKNLWNPVDNAYLVKWLERNVQKEPLDASKEGKMVKEG